MPELVSRVTDDVAGDRAPIRARARERTRRLRALRKAGGRVIALRIYEEDIAGLIGAGFLHLDHDGATLAEAIFSAAWAGINIATAFRQKETDR